MTFTKCSGVHSALVTPFNKEGHLDTGALSEIIALQRMDGIDGIVLLGTTGESPTLSIDEREILVRFAKDHMGSMAVIAGAGSNCTKSAIELQKAMENAGADATLQVVPYYNKPTQEGLYKHFSAIAKDAKIPIILYNAAGRTGTDISPATVARIASDNEMVIGIKDANVNIERLSDLIRLSKEARSDFLVLSGEDSAFTTFLAMGGDGIISVISQIAAMEMLAIYKAVKNKDLVYAQKISHKLNNLCKAIFSHTNPIPIKTILASMGLLEKSWRLPLCALMPEEEQELIKKCREYAFLNSFKARGFLQ